MSDDTGSGDLDQLIEAAHAQRIGGLFVHGRRGRMRDRGADQSGEKALAGWSWAFGHGRYRPTEIGIAQEDRRKCSG